MSALPDLQLPDFIVPDWPAPTRVRALQTTRWMGSCAPNTPLDQWPLALPALTWLNQVHGTTVVPAEIARKADKQTENLLSADACYAHQTGVVCAIRTADCLPVLFTNRAGTAVAAAHAGWRGLLNGVLENTVNALRQQQPKTEWMAWLGAAIGPNSYEVGSEVVEAFIERDSQAAQAVQAKSNGRFLLDLYALARQRLIQVQVHEVFGGGRDTYLEDEHFFSFRRGDVTERMATLIWLEN